MSDVATCPPHLYIHERLSNCFGGVYVSVEALDGDAPATRDDQLGLKVARKKRNRKTKKPTKKKKSGGKSKQGQKGNIKSKPARRRAVLKRARSHSPVPEDADVAQDDAEMPDGATVHYEPETPGATPRPSTGAKPKAAAKGRPKAKAKAAKATPKAKAGAKAKAGPKPKAGAKAKAGAKPKAGAKAKAGPKAKAGAKAKAGPKAKATAKKRGRSEASGGMMDEARPTTLEGWWQLDVAFIMTGFAAEFVDHQDASLADFKRIMRDVLSPGDYISAALNVYWTRHACGLTIKDVKKDLTSFRFVNSVVKNNLLQAVSIKAAQLMAIGLCVAHVLLQTCSMLPAVLLLNIRCVHIHTTTP